MMHMLCVCAGDYRLEKRAVPDLADGDVLVRVLAVGICAGDAKCYAGVPYFWGTEIYTVLTYCLPKIDC